MGKQPKFREESSRYKPTPDAFRRMGEKTHGQGRHRAHQANDRISFRTPSGRDTGTVIEAHKEFYIVRTGDEVIKVNRNSILYSLGTFVGGVAQLAQNTKKAYEFGKGKEDERLEKFKSSYGKKKRTVKRKITKKK